jgi:hypothetical protein
LVSFKISPLAAKHVYDCSKDKSKCTVFDMPTTVPRKKCCKIRDGKKSEVESVGGQTDTRNGLMTTNRDECIALERADVVFEGSAVDSVLVDHSKRVEISGSACAEETVNLDTVKNCVAGFNTTVGISDSITTANSKADCDPRIRRTMLVGSNSLGDDSSKRIPISHPNDQSNFVYKQNPDEDLLVLRNAVGAVVTAAGVLVKSGLRDFALPEGTFGCMMAAKKDELGRRGPFGEKNSSSVNKQRFTRNKQLLKVSGSSSGNASSLDSPSASRMTPRIGRQRCCHRTPHDITDLPTSANCQGTELPTIKHRSVFSRVVR